MATSDVSALFHYLVITANKQIQEHINKGFLLTGFRNPEMLRLSLNENKNEVERIIYSAV